MNRYPCGARQIQLSPDHDSIGQSPDVNRIYPLPNTNKIFMFSFQFPHSFSIFSVYRMNLGAVDEKIFTQCLSLQRMRIIQIYNKREYAGPVHTTIIISIQGFAETRNKNSIGENLYVVAQEYLFFLDYLLFD